MYDFYFEDLACRVQAARARAAARAYNDGTDGEEDADEEDEANDTSFQDENEDFVVEEDGVESDNDYVTRRTGPAAGTARFRRRIPGCDREDHVKLSSYRDEMVVDPRGNLRANLPRLSQASRHFHAETLHYTFDANYEFLIHVEGYRIDSLFEYDRLTRLLADVCGVEIRGSNTTIILGRRWWANTESENLKSWMNMYWHDEASLFDTNLETFWRSAPFPTGGKSWGHSSSHPTYQLAADYERKCFGILKYLYMLHTAEPEYWEEIARMFLNGWEKVLVNRSPNGKPGQLSTYMRHPMQEPPPKTYPNILDAVIDALVVITAHGDRQHKTPRDIAIENLVDKTYKEAEKAAIQSLGDKFEAMEEQNLQRKRLLEFEESDDS